MEAEIGTARIQRVSKASSAELLRKFAEADSDSDTCSSAVKRAERAAKRRKTRWENVDKESRDGVDGGVAERKSLLAPAAGRPRSVVLRRMGITRSQTVRAKNRYVMGAIHKTWSKAVRGASRVFIEKHYNTHRRLINDVV